MSRFRLRARRLLQVLGTIGLDSLVFRDNVAAGTVLANVTGKSAGSDLTFSPNDGRVVLSADGSQLLRGLSAWTDGALSLTFSETPAGGGVANVGAPIACTIAAQAAISFGAMTLVGFGGLPTAETPNTAVTGANASSFKIDFRGHLVPAVGGAGTYGATWTGAPSGTTTVIGGSGLQYVVTILPDTAHAREMYGTAQHADTTSSHQLDSTLATLTNTTAKTILCRDGWLNPTNLSYDLNSPRTASGGSHYTGTARITIKSENRDNGPDYAVNPRLQHGFKIGAIAWSSNADLIEYVDFEDVWSTANVSGPSDLFRMANVGGHNPFGINFTNCRFDYTGNTGGIDGPNVNGPCAFKGCQFVNLGGGQQGHGIVCNTGLTAWDCIFDGSLLDSIDINGFNHSILRCLFKNNNIGNGDHGDNIQLANLLHTVTPGGSYTPGFYPNVAMTGGGTVGVIMNIVVKSDGTVLPTNTTLNIAGTDRATEIINKGSTYVEGVAIKPTNDAFDGGVGDRGFRLTTRVSGSLGEIRDNVIIADQGLFGAAQGIFFSNIDYPIQLQTGGITGNIIMTTAGNGLIPTAVAGCDISRNWVCFDPFRLDSPQNVNFGTGTGGYAGPDLTLSFNGMNAINTSAWTGVKTENPTEANQSYPVSSLTSGQIITLLGVTFNGFPTTKAAYLARAQTYAGARAMFVPNKTFKSSAGGARLAGDFYNGPLFPDATANNGLAYTGP